MSVTGTDIQTGFLRTLINERKVVWIFLVNGIKLTGQLASFDKYVIALESPTGMQTVFKSAVSTVGEAHAVERPQTGARPAIPPERQTALGSPTLVDGRPHSTLRSRGGMVLGRLNEPREIASLDPRCPYIRSLIGSTTTDAIRRQDVKRHADRKGRAFDEFIVRSRPGAGWQLECPQTDGTFVVVVVDQAQALWLANSA